jgi:NAD(P)-dependent dehydrogenase (short-subunit alcohol dehydrogenase family)
VLINNAGISAAGRVHDTALELWERIMRINARGIFLTAKAVLPTMISQRAGVIVNLSSIIATTGLPNRAAYAASKGAVLALTCSMQVDYGPLGIRVNALMPGTIFTPMLAPLLKASFGNEAEALAAIRHRQLTEVLGQAEDVAKAALFLASDDASFVMGTGLVVDGGISHGRR